MSITTPRDSAMMAERTRERQLEHLSIDAWVLCREFVERIVLDAQRTGARKNPGAAGHEIDWEAIWQVGEGAPSDEAAIGRIIRAAWEVAHRIDPDAPDPCAEPAWGERVDGAVDPGAQTTTAAPAEDHRVALVGTPVPVVEPAAEPAVDPVVASAVGPVAPPEPVAAAVEPATAVMERVVGPPEPAAVRVVLAPPAAGSVVLDRPDAGATTAVEPDQREQRQIAPEFLVGTDEVGAGKRRFALSHAEWVTVFTWIRNLGAIMLLFVAWQLWGTSISQHQAQDRLKAAFDASVKAHHPNSGAASGSSLIPAGTKVPSPPDGSVVARLQIPAIGVDQYVVAGTSAAQLSQGPGHYDGTAMPGQAGNVAIAGHRTTNGAPFNRLGQLVSGDRITLTTTSGEHLVYVVSGTPQAVSPGDVAVLNYFGDNRITLTTCTPEFSAAQRLIVVGQLKTPVGKTKTLPAGQVSYHVANSATASWDWSSLPVVGIEVCLLLLLGLSYRRCDVWFGRRSKWIILAPLWAAGLYLVFHALTGFLPETF